MFPYELFIYGTDFQDIESLVESCLSLDRKVRDDIRLRIKSMVASDKFIEQFGSAKFCKTVVEGINSVI